MSKRQGQPQEDDRKKSATASPKRRKCDSVRASPSSNEVIGGREHFPTSSETVAENPHHQQQQHRRIQALPSDIILGRGRLHAKNEGNAYYYEILDSFKAVYQVAESKGDKTRIVRNIYQHLSDRKARFLKRSDSGTCFFELHETLAKKKIGHGIRFRLEVGVRPELRDEGQDIPSTGSHSISAEIAPQHSFQNAAKMSNRMPPPVASSSRQVPGNSTLSIPAGICNPTHRGTELEHVVSAIASSSPRIEQLSNNPGTELPPSSGGNVTTTAANNGDSPLTSSSSSSSVPSQRQGRRRSEGVQGQPIDRGSSSSNRSFSSISSLNNSGLFSQLELAQVLGIDADHVDGHHHHQSHFFEKN